MVNEGELTRLIGVTRNVTGRAERERGLRQQNERLGEFASVISHDLRNTLHVAQARATLLAEQIESEHLETLVRALDRMKAIVENTLVLAQQGGRISETDPISLTDLVGNCWGQGTQISKSSTR